MENINRLTRLALVLGILSMTLAFFGLNHPAGSLMIIIFAIGTFMITDGGYELLKKVNIDCTGFVTSAAVVDVVIVFSSSLCMELLG